MKISLIIPVYNEELFLDRCLTSVCKQTRLPEEIIICDNASTDSSMGIARRYSKTLPLKIVTEKRKGIIYAVNRLCRQAHGDLIIRVDADTVMSSKWVENMEKHFLDDKNLAAAGGYFFSLENNFIYHLGAAISNPIVDLLFYLRYGHILLFGSSFAIRRSVLSNIDSFNPVKNLTTVDDQLISHKLAMHGYKFKKFIDCISYTSIRRYQQQPVKEVTIQLLGVTVNPNHYRERV